jgi:hypothetical protein
MFLKTWKFPNKKGTFDVNLVFTATLACTKRHFSSQKRALFIKKATFSPLKKLGGGGHVPPPRFLRPCYLSSNFLPSLETSKISHLSQVVPWAYGPGGHGGACAPPKFYGRAKITAKFWQNIKISEKF